MKPAPFEYVAPRSLDEAVALLAQYGDEAKVIAGGQSLVPMMAFRLATPAVLVALHGGSAPDYVPRSDDSHVLGAVGRAPAAPAVPGGPGAGARLGCGSGPLGAPPP